VKRSSCHQCACCRPAALCTRQRVGVTSRERGSSLWIFCTWTVCLKCVLELTFTNVVLSFRKHPCPMGGFCILAVCELCMLLERSLSKRQQAVEGRKGGLRPGHHRRGWGGPSPLSWACASTAAKGQTRLSLPASLGS